MQTMEEWRRHLEHAVREVEEAERRLADARAQKVQVEYEIECLNKVARGVRFRSLLRAEVRR